MKQPLIQVLLVCLCCCGLTGQATSGSLADGQNAYVVSDFAAAEMLFRPLAERGNVTAQTYLGRMYAKGQGVAQNFKEAMSLFQSASAQGNASAQHNLVVMYSEGRGVPQDNVRALMWENISASKAAMTDSKNQTERIEQPDFIAMYMTRKQINKARKLSNECMARNLKGC